MKNSIFKIVAFFLVFCQANVLGQTANDAVAKFNNEQKYLAEKMYVHTDKPQYFVGDFLWFKLYNLKGAAKGFSDLSKVAYVELVDGSGVPKLQTMVALKMGRGNGSLELTAALETGVYNLRAYTNLMKNGGPELFFEKKLTIINPSLQLKVAEAKKRSYDVTLFPEGGDLIEGISANVAFKATNQDGEGIPLKGIIIDDRNDTVANFSTLKYGIGKFFLPLKAGRTYKAVCVTPDKEILIKQLSDIKKSGYSLQLKEIDNAFEVFVGSNLADNNVSILVHNGKQVIEAQSVAMMGGAAKFAIDKTKFTGGIYHLTLFDAKGMPVAERLFFKRNPDKVTFNAALNKATYGTRDKVVVEAVANDEKGLNKFADASFAIYKVDSFQQQDETDIVSYLQLSSEVKGYIEDPQYYFSVDNEETNKALDNLLLTQGWRRFNWEKTGNTSGLKYLPEYNGHLISGKVTSADNKPVNNLAVYLSSPRKLGNFYHTKTDSTGTFVFNTNKFLGYNELIVQADYTKDSTSQIAVSNPYYEQYLKNTYQPFLFNNKLKELENYYFYAQVQDVYSKRFFNKFNISRSEFNFYGKPNKTYFLADYTRFGTLEEVLREYVSEVFVSRRQKNFQLRLVGGSEILEKDPLVLYDGVPYFDLNKMMAVSPDDIEKVEVVRDRYYYNGDTYEGIVNFYSKKATVSDYALNPKAIIVDYEGMQLQREFYAPKYEVSNSANKHLPDYRNMLHWEPNLIFNGKDKAKVSFYTSDLAGTYVGVIQGVSADGTPGFNTFKIEVKK